MADVADPTCPDDSRVHNTILDNCVIRRSSLVGCPTMKFNHNRPAGDTVGPYSYNEGAQPLYDDLHRLSGFQFATHATPPPSGVEVWQIKPDGSSPVKRADATTHGCMISPANTLMVCEDTRPSGGADILLKKADGSLISSILKPGEYERGLFARWSPDSTFLVYFSEIGGLGGAGRLVYQSVENLQHLGDSAHHKILADGKVPGFYCRVFSKCGPLGKGNLGSDFAAFSPLLPGQKRPKWLVLAIQKDLWNPLPNQQFKRVLYGISLDKSESPKEIELPNDVGYPTFSPDGKSVAFLSIRAPEDPRTQLFVANWRTKRWKQVTFIEEKNRQVYNPHWAD